MRAARLLSLLILFGFIGVANALPIQEAFFECLWWSPAQMTNLDPNRPPPMTTPTRIARWEYSDPVGVPHPDMVTLVVRVTKADAAMLSVRIQWLGKSWMDGAPVRRTQGPGDESDVQTLRYDIPVKAFIERHAPRKLRAGIYRGPDRVKSLELPIQLGD